MKERVFLVAACGLGAAIVAALLDADVLLAGAICTAVAVVAVTFRR